MAPRSNSSLWTTILCLSSLFIGSTFAQQKELVFCSSQNTGSSFASVYKQFQTTGACRDTCRGQYSVAIIQDYTCWCSNLAPSDQQSLDLCDDVCPGFGDLQCGNAAQGLYAYFLIDGRSPSGTVAASGTSTTRSVSTFPSGSGFPGPPRSTLDGGSSSLTVSATQQSSRTSSSSVVSSTSTTQAQVTQIITTITGQVRTVVITPTSTPDSSLGASPSNSGGSKVSPGTIAGIVVGVVVGVGAVVGLAVWFCFRRKRQDRLENGSSAGSSARESKNGIPSRQVSQMSSAGLLNRIPRIRTEGLAAGNGPKSAESSQMDRRSLGTDQRLNPYAIYAHEESRLSNVSLQDNQDYSRQLRVANPDI